MENDSVRSIGENTLVDVWIDGKLRGITLPRDAIEAYLQLRPDQAVSMTDDDRREFVRTHLGIVVGAARKALEDQPAADSVTISAAQLGAREPAPPAERRGEFVDRRRGDRRRGDRRGPEQRRSSEHG
jgi:hypothetical protein